MKELSYAKFIEQKSIFHAYFFKVDSEDQLKEIIKTLSTKYKKVKHICYGAIIESEEIESFKNDGEVGQPGKTLLDMIRKKGYSSHVLVVARIFGGVKLGPGGVKRAFKESGKLCLNLISQ